MQFSQPSDVGLRARLAALDAIVTYSVTDLAGRIVAFNDLYCQLSGYHPDELLGADHRILTLEAAASSAFADMYRTLGRGASWRGELSFISKQGAAFWIDLSVSPQCDSAGVVTGYASTGIDITSRKRAEDALRQSETMLRTTLAALSEGIVVQDAEGRVVSCNPAAEPILRIMSQQVAGDDPEDPRWRAIREDGSEFPESQHPARVALATGEPQSDVVMGLRGETGQVTWISVNAQPVFSEGSAKPTSVVTSSSDITARKLAQETLKEAVATIPDGFVVYDNEDRLVLCNEAYREVYKQSAPAIRPGAAFEDILRFGLESGQYPESGATEEQRKAWFDERLRRHRSLSQQMLQQLPDGRWLQIRENRTPSGYIVGFRTDVTELKHETAKLQAVIDNFPGGIALYDSDFKLVASNEQFRVLLDLPEELFANGPPTLEMLIRTNAKRGEFGPGDIEEQVERRMAVVRQQKPHVFQRVRPNGTVLEIHSTPIEGGGFVSAFIDITERHAAQQRLAASERRARAQSENLQLTLANMSQGLSMFDADGALTVWNNRFLELYGLPPDIVKEGVSVETIFQLQCQNGNLDVDVAAYVEQVRQHLATDGIWKSTLHIRDGRVVQVVRTAVSGGGWLAIHEDITDKQRAETELRDQAAELARINMRFEAALTHMSQGICLFDASKKLVICNKRFLDMYHFSSDQIGPGTSLETLLRQLARNGETSEKTVEEHLQTLPNRLDETFRLADGRVIAIRRRPTPEGGWLATHEDITERERADQKISHLAYHDVLTGLANRAEFKRQGEAVLARSAQTGGTISVLLIDLDRFKAVNDTFGHAAGDELLRMVTERMRQSVRANDIVARLGGDEFAIVQDGAPDPREAAISLAARLVDVLGAPYELNGHQAMIGASIGIAVQSTQEDTIEQLMHRADLALYRVKGGGRNGYRIYEDGLGSEEQERLRLGNELRGAIEANSLEVRYEPIVSLADRRVCGMEARVHWVHPSRGLLEPAAFLYIAEEAGLTVALGEFVLHRACLDAERWPEQVKLTVNIAATHVKKRTLMDAVTRALIRARMTPERLDIAITETALLQTDEDVLAELHQLQSLGVSIVIDGYGIGNASLNHLRVFPFDRIKIDRTMIAEIAERPESAAIVCAVTGLARSLDILTTAEGVESEEQMRMLQAAGCNQGQGGIFGSVATATETLSRLLIEHALPDLQHIG
jgi:diguanylate cyclase (GGDEF)-like protein/PAS domain S-box-containing protein